MKKLLVTTTALVAFTGAAAADVDLTGRAEMGLFDTNAAGVGVQFFTDIDVTFTMTGETDNGLTFGASVDLDEGGAQAAVNNNADDGGATIFISGGFGTVTMGDTDGALDWALTEAGNVGNPGSIADDETSHAGYNGSYLDGAQDGQILRWNNTFGDFGIAVSIDDDNGASGTSPGYAVGLTYTLDLSGTAVNLGIGYQESDITNPTFAFAGIPLPGPATPIVEAEAFGVSANATFANGLSAGLAYTMFEFSAGGVTGEVDHIGLGLGYTSGAFSAHINYGEYSYSDAFAGIPDTDGFGVSAAYDLGGGAVVHFGHGSGSAFGGANATTTSLGLGLSF